MSSGFLWESAGSSPDAAVGAFGPPHAPGPSRGERRRWGTASPAPAATCGGRGWGLAPSGRRAVSEPPFPLQRFLPGPPGCGVVAPVLCAGVIYLPELNRCRLLSRKLPKGRNAGESSELKDGTVGIGGEASVMVKENLSRSLRALYAAFEVCVLTRNHHHRVTEGCDHPPYSKDIESRKSAVHGPRVHS